MLTFSSAVILTILGLTALITFVMISITCKLNAYNKKLIRMRKIETSYYEGQIRELNNLNAFLINNSKDYEWNCYRDPDNKVYVNSDSVDGYLCIVCSYSGPLGTKCNCVTIEI